MREKSNFENRRSGYCSMARKTIYVFSDSPSMLACSCFIVVSFTSFISVCIKDNMNFVSGRVSQKNYLTLSLNFEAVTTLMSGSLGFPVSPDLYDSFDTLHVCFHGVMNNWQ